MLRVALFVLLIAMNAEGAELIARTSYCPQWSPDGKQLIFYSEIAGRWRILKINIDGSNLTTLSPASEYDEFYPSFSPKGDRILFYSNRDGNQEIFSMGMDGSNVRRLTPNTAADRYPRWSPDGKSIAYSSGINDQYEIHVINADGSASRQITHLIAEESLIDSRDSKSYPVVRPGAQLWMARNLAFAAEESWCHKDAEDCIETGRLYTWDAAMRACPEGWHLPTDEEWIALEIHLGMSQEDAKNTGARGKQEGAKMQSGGSSGLQMPISGYRRPTGEFVRAGERAAYWTATESNEEDAWHRDIRSDVGTVYRSPVTKTYALSVRCVRTEQ